MGSSGSSLKGGSSVWHQMMVSVVRSNCQLQKGRMRLSYSKPLLLWMVTILTPSTSSPWMVFLW